MTIKPNFAMEMQFFPGPADGLRQYGKEAWPFKAVVVDVHSDTMVTVAVKKPDKGCCLREHTFLRYPEMQKPTEQSYCEFVPAAAPKKDAAKE